MPFKSKRQARWAFSKAGRKALGGRKRVKEWAHATNYSRLPESAKKAPR